VNRLVSDQPPKVLGRTETRLGQRHPSWRRNNAVLGFCAIPAWVEGFMGEKYGGETSVLYEVMTEGLRRSARLRGRTDWWIGTTTESVAR